MPWGQVLVNAWESHWCGTFANATRSLHGLLNRTAAWARRAGVLVVHSPTDAVGSFAAHPARRTRPPARPLWPGSTPRARFSHARHPTAAPHCADLGVSERSRERARQAARAAGAELPPYSARGASDLPPPPLEADSPPGAAYIFGTCASGERPPAHRTPQQPAAGVAVDASLDVVVDEASPRLMPN